MSRGLREGIGPITIGRTVTSTDTGQDRAIETTTGTETAMVIDTETAMVIDTETATGIDTETVMGIDTETVMGIETEIADLRGTAVTTPGCTEPIGAGHAMMRTNPAVQGRIAHVVVRSRGRGRKSGPLAT